MSEQVAMVQQITAAGALAVVGAAQAKAEELGVGVSIVVADPSGDVVASLRLDRASRMSFEMASVKARSAARLGHQTGPLPDGLGEALAQASPKEFTQLRGGLTLKVDGALVGAIGVGGATPDQDVEIGQAAAAALVS